MRSSLVQAGSPPFTVSSYIKNYVTPIDKGDIRCEVPPGYPANLPAPYYLSDKRIVLKKVPVNFELSNADVAWIMVALQNAINVYSPRPYPINWEVAGKGSGFGRIVECVKKDDTAANFVLWKFYDFSPQPDVGGDPLGKMLLGTVLSFIPGGNLIGNTLGLLSNMFGNQPGTNLPPPASGSGSGNVTPGGGGGQVEDKKFNIWPWVAGAFAALAVYFYDDE
jgi:hypothetical protein